MNSKFGKVVLLRKLGVIDKNQASAIRALGELRNKLAHKISNSNFTFATYIQTLDNQQLENMTNNFGCGIHETITVAEVVMSRREYVLASPKKALFLTANSILAHLHNQIQT
ncbi:hypothetical protein CRENPOLYSF2_1390027 [Crenothrix polyspora]|uniref:Uncharacterized protein n=1 Tax=Crenothrix polyspora TaxID=360316 RepID=A0A1R4H0Z6_9GAMM|nr:hypothetical protein [Crenothrix polyspora]SJM89923.1 hypothetical protein CRENPOLYSF2_1390027 [Crenothrix polyspora]